GKGARAMPTYDALLYRAEEPGDFVEAAIDVVEAGKYEVVVESLDYTDRGMIQVSLDGEPIGDPIDQQGTMQPARVEDSLGVHDIAAGDHVLRFEVVGRNPQSDGSYFAITAVKLFRPDEREQAAETGANRFTLAWPAGVPATLDRDTETLGKYLPISPHRDQALNVVEQSMSRRLAPGEPACFVNAFSAWEGDDPALEVRRIGERAALVSHAGEVALVGASAWGAEAQVGPVSASGILFLVSPSRVILHDAEASVDGKALTAGATGGDAVAEALRAAWEQADNGGADRADRWADLPDAPVEQSVDLADRPLSVEVALGGDAPRIAVGMQRGAVAQFTPDAQAAGQMTTGGPVHALEAADLDGDGTQELIAGSDDEVMYALASDMGELWRHEVDFLKDQQPWSWWTLGSAKVRAIHATDVAGDARPELIVGAGNMRVQAYDAAGELLWRYRTDHGIATTLASADLFGDGRNLLLVGNGLTSSSGMCWVLDENGEMIQRYYNGSWCTSLPAIAVGDLDGDGVNTVFTGSNRGHVRAYAPDQQYPTELWIRNLTRPIRSLTAIPREEGGVLAVGSDSGYLVAFDQSGEIAWGVGLSSAIPFTAMVSGHEQPLLAAGCRDGRVSFVTADGQITSTADLGGRLEAMVVADVDADGADEVVAATSGPDRVLVVEAQARAH
ncbi:MAG: PQQ-binding-like beta-propeller repeat protein, partial [Armatimonadia bacterium]|nr:PQQ-binding-like beta-propeller repeat protein [Armatimonadia bacterium]